MKYILGLLLLAAIAFVVTKAEAKPTAYYGREGGWYRPAREGGWYRPAREGGWYRPAREGGWYRPAREGGWYRPSYYYGSGEEWGK
jgi:hypothetical protein